jgi:hypothetical protein
MIEKPPGRDDNVVDLRERRRAKKAITPRDSERKVLLPRPANDIVDPRTLPSADIVPISTETGLDQLAEEFENQIAATEPAKIINLVQEFISYAQGLVIDSDRLSSASGMAGGWTATDEELKKIRRQAIPALERSITTNTNPRMELEMRERGIAMLHSVARAMKSDLAEADTLRKQKGEF